MERALKVDRGILPGELVTFYYASLVGVEGDSAVHRIVEDSGMICIDPDPDGGLGKIAGNDVRIGFP